MPHELKGLFRRRNNETLNTAAPVCTARVCWRLIGENKSVVVQINPTLQTVTPKGTEEVLGRQSPLVDPACALHINDIYAADNTTKA